MISDEERREAIKFLHARNTVLCSSLVYCDKCMDVSRFIFGDTVELCILESRVGIKSWKRLAYLIDRPVTRNLASDGAFKCERCGAEWPVNLAFMYCPHCGAEVVTD